MGLKKYEIITVGSDKRVRALRSWQVGDRYVNIGDVGGIVYDEKTLSQDGACWLFRGNFGFPGARIGGDSIVDVGEVGLSATGAPNVDILGSSVVVGSKLRFESRQTSADAVVLGESFFEQGTLSYAAGSNWETWKQPSPNYLRTKAPIFNGGVSTTVLKLEVPGYTVQAYALDRDGSGMTATASTNTGEGVTIAIPRGQYFMLRLTKNPSGAIVPADATAAQITFTGTYETKLSIIDSRVEINPATSAGTATIRPGGTYTMSSGAKYPDSVMQNSKVSILTHATADRTVTLMAEFIDTSAVIDASIELAPAIPGIYKNVKNLAFSGSITGDAGVGSHGVIQATDCDNFTASSTIFPGLAAAQTASMPFIFQGCNVPNGRFYHHAQIANTYKNIDFAKASVDLGKTTVNGYVMASSEVEGMYCLYDTSGSVFGALAEAHDSVKSLNMAGGAATYGTTIYKDAYLNGMFDFAGTNVFGNKVRSPLAQVLNVQPRAVQGDLDTVSPGGVITRATGVANRVCVLESFRINSGQGLSVDNIPAGIAVSAVYATPVNTVVTSTGWANTSWKPAVPALAYYAVYLRFKKSDDTAITPEDLAGVTVTVYNGCKLVNTKETTATIAGNVRVEDNATLIDVSVTGTGYFGGNSIIQAPSALVGQLPIVGAAFMSDGAVFAPSVVHATASLSSLKMKDNAVFAGSINTAGTNYNITMTDNARFLGVHGSRSGFVMRGNSFVAAGAAVLAGCRGLLILKDDARIESNSITAVGHITLCGKYKQTANRYWTGERVIASQDAPTYDDNVKTQYDF